MIENVMEKIEQDRKELMKDIDELERRVKQGTEWKIKWLKKRKKEVKENGRQW